MFAEIQGKYIFVCVYCKVKSKKGKLKNVITIKTIILQGTRYLGSYPFLMQFIVAMQTILGFDLILANLLNLLEWKLPHIFPYGSILNS